MSHNAILVTGGAGFLGSHLAIALAGQSSSPKVYALDNLKRRGSELNLPRLRAAGVHFVHGDIRCPEDLQVADEIDLIVECSAEPSVTAGLHGTPSYVVNTNLLGTINCLELARQRGADFFFISTSRVYPIAQLEQLSYQETATRYELDELQSIPGCSGFGISEDFPMIGQRSLYGATKLSSELMIEEYRAAYGLRTIVNRYGVIAGPWQMGKADQGVFALWVLAHYFKRPLKYIGYGGTGKQSRDLIHVRDVSEIVLTQLDRIEALDGSTYNAGGGRDISLSLCEATDLCREITGNRTEIEPIIQTRQADVPIYISDSRKLRAATGLSATTGAARILEDIFTWVRENEALVKSAL